MSHKFEFIGTTGNTILQKIITNQNLLKYMYYLDNDPLDDSKANVSPKYWIETETPRSENRIFLSEFNERITTDDKIMLFFYPLKPDRNFNSNSVVSGDLFSLDIVIPSNKWVLYGKNKLRAFMMAHEISQDIDQKNIAGIGDTEIISWGTGTLKNTNYKVLMLTIKIDSSIKSAVNRIGR